MGLISGDPPCPLLQTAIGHQRNSLDDDFHVIDIGLKYGPENGEERDVPHGGSLLRRLPKDGRWLLWSTASLVAVFSSAGLPASRRSRVQAYLARRDEALTVPLGDTGDIPVAPQHDDEGHDSSSLHIHREQEEGGPHGELWWPDRMGAWAGRACAALATRFHHTTQKVSSFLLDGLSPGRESGPDVGLVVAAGRKRQPRLNQRNLATQRMRLPCGRITTFVLYCVA